MFRVSTRHPHELLIYAWPKKLSGIFLVMAFVTVFTLVVANLLTFCKGRELVNQIIKTKCSADYTKRFKICKNFPVYFYNINIF